MPRISLNPKKSSQRNQTILIIQYRVNYHPFSIIYKCTKQIKYKKRSFNVNSTTTQEKNSTERESNGRKREKLRRKKIYFHLKSSHFIPLVFVLPSTTTIINAIIKCHIWKKDKTTLNNRQQKCYWTQEKIKKKEKKPFSICYYGGENDFFRMEKIAFCYIWKEEIFFILWIGKFLRRAL